MDNNTNIIFESIRKHRRKILFEQDGQKTIEPNSDYFKEQLSAIGNFTDGTITVSVSAIEYDYQTQYFLINGSLNNKIDWYFTISSNSDNGFFISTDNYNMDVDILQTMTKMLQYFNNTLADSVKENLSKKSFPTK